MRSLIRSIEQRPVGMLTRDGALVGHRCLLPFLVGWFFVVFRGSVSGAVQEATTDSDHHLFTSLQQAADLPRGRFLEGFSLDDAPDFDDWIRLQRAIWHRRMSLIYDRLSQMQQQSGVLPSAIETTSRWIIHDPLNESAHRRMMLLHNEDASGEQVARRPSTRSANDKPDAGFASGRSHHATGQGAEYREHAV